MPENRTETTQTNNNAALEEYISSIFAPQDQALLDVVSSLEERNIPKMQVSASQGKLLFLLASMVRAKRILEIGTLAGYSGIHLARALPADGQLYTFEVFPQHVALARKNFEKAGLIDKVKVFCESTTDTLRQMAANNEEPFDMIFIDANKNHYPEYLSVSLPLLRNGGLLIADNTLKDALSEENNGIKEYNDLVAKNPELISVALPMLRRFGLDGLTISLKQAHL